MAENDCFRLVEALKCDHVWHRLPEERYQFPVLAAFANGHQAVLQALLGDGAAVFMDDIVRDPGFSKPSQLRLNQDLLLWATESNNWTFAKCLVSLYAYEGLFSIDSKAWPGRNSQGLLSIAATRGARAVVQVLLDRGADVNAQDRNDGNALYAASVRGHEKVVQLLLDRGADFYRSGRKIC